jgi:hypothetical protein
VTISIKIGTKYSQLTVLRVQPRGSGKSRWITCRCDCGKQHATDAGRLLRGISRRCPSCANPKLPSGESVLRKREHLYKNDARRRGLDWWLSRERFRELLAAPCSYCGVSPGSGIDRRDNTQGYFKANSIPCCKQCNFAKRDLPESDFLAWVTRIAINQGFSL